MHYIKYYHDKGDLNSRSTMECHLESIKSFYDYLSEVDKAKDIFSDYSYSNPLYLYKYSKILSSSFMGSLFLDSAYFKAEFKGAYRHGNLLKSGK